MAPRLTTYPTPRLSMLQFGLIASAVIVLSSGCRRPPPPAAEGGGDDVKAGPIVVEIAVASRMRMDTTIVAQGVIVAAQGSNAHVAAAAPGRLVSVQAKEGDRVEAGKVIAVVDNRPQQAAVTSAAAAVGASEALAHEADLAHRAAAADQSSSVRVAELALQTAQMDRDGAIRTAQNQLQAAETDLVKTKNGPRPQEISQADQAVTQAGVTRTRAHAELDRTHRLLDGGIASQRQLEDAQSASDLADSAYASAKSQANLMHAGSRPEDLEAARIRVEGAADSLKLAKSDGEAHVAQARAVLLQAKQSLLAVQAKEQDARAVAAGAQQKRSDLAAAQASAQYAEVRAPFSGKVTKRFLNPGDMADATTPIIEISDTRRLNLLANLPASESGKLMSGMPVRITSRDVPGSTINGAVLSVGQVDPNTNLLSVRIRVQDANSALRIGSYALATIVLSTDPNSIVVPSAAVLSREGKSDVFVVGSDNVAHEKEVEVGPEHAARVAIKTGIAAGDRVAVLGNYELSDGALVKEADKGQAESTDSAQASDKKEPVPAAIGASNTQPNDRTSSDEKKTPH